MVVAPPTSNDMVISGSLPCIRCGYDLDTRAVGTPCPECGSSTALSLESLWLEDPAYVRRLVRGLNWMLTGALVGPVVYLLALFTAFLAMNSSGSEGFLVFFAGAALAAGPVIAWRGTHLFAWPRPGRPVANKELWTGARILAAAYAVCFGLVVTLSVTRTWGLWMPDQEFLVIVSLVAGEAWCFRNLLVIAHIRGLAQVSCMPRIAMAAPFFQAAAGGLAVVGAIFALTTMSGFRGRPSWFFIVPYLTVAVGMLIWLLAWPIYLGRVARGLKQIVRQVDARGRPVVVPLPSSNSGGAPKTSADGENP